MKLWSAIRRQTVDFIVYLVLPLASVFLPAVWSRALLARSSNLNWVLSTEAEAAWSSARKYVDTGDEKVWKARWKQVEMLDARDMYMMSFGRTRSVLGEIECDTPLETVKDSGGRSRRAGVTKSESLGLSTRQHRIPRLAASAAIAALACGSSLAAKTRRAFSRSVGR